MPRVGRADAGWDIEERSELKKFEDLDNMNGTSESDETGSLNALGFIALQHPLELFRPIFENW